MKKSYLAMVEYPDKKFTQFFTGKAKIRSQRAIDEADDWIASILREHGTAGVRTTISEVLICVAG